MYIDSISFSSTFHVISRKFGLIFGQRTASLSKRDLQSLNTKRKEELNILPLIMQENEFLQYFQLESVDNIGILSLVKSIRCRGLC